MFKNRINRFRRLMNTADGGEGGSGASGVAPAGTPAPAPTPADPPAGDPPKGDNRPSDKEAELLKEVMKRKEREKQLAEQLNTVQEQLKQFEGINLDEIQKLVAEKKDRETKELEARGEYERIRAQMVEEHQNTVAKTKKEAEEKISGLTKQLEGLQGQLTELTIGRAFGESPFIREALTLTPAKTRVVYGSHFEVVDGSVVAYDKPKGASERTMLVDGEGKPLSFEKALAKIVEADPDKNELLRSKIKPGSGSNNDPGQKPKPKIGVGRDRIAAALASGALNNQ